MTILRKTAIFWIYLILSLTIGEFHPFSQFPMYRSFPNWAYVFYIKDGNNELIPWKDHLNIGSGSFAHKYYAICNKRDIDYGFDLESKEEMQDIGSTIDLWYLTTSHSFRHFVLDKYML